MHMEHDVEVTWAAVGAWAADNALLEPLGFQRGFVRTEIAPWSARAMAADAQAPVNLTEYSRWLSVTDGLDVSRSFLQLPHPFSGAWVATHRQLERFISWQLSSSRSKEANKAEAAANTILFAGPLPNGFTSSAVVPFEWNNSWLSRRAHVHRVSNELCAYWDEGGAGPAYSNTRPPPGMEASKCTIQVDEYLVY
ncbi:hypothetical protein WJX75_005638 [Coccomyxa subellipsoidea]|uniref:Uncharacterized protein n=1 Tax=Coccomyxa subellipsoidea TaxID=248742 RepID=A0ABR2Z3U7_9CHLO